MEQTKAKNAKKQQQIKSLKQTNDGLENKINLVKERLKKMKDEFEDKNKFEDLLTSASELNEDELSKTRHPRKYSGESIFNLDFILC